MTSNARNTRTASIGLLLAAVMCAWVLAARAAQVVVYRWVDPESHQVHYSDTIPRATGYETVAIEDAPLRDAEAERRLAALQAETTRWASSQLRESRIQQQEEADSATRVLDCAKARSSLERLNLRPGRRLRLVESDGTARRMTEAERQERLADSEQSVSVLCEGSP